MLRSKSFATNFIIRKSKKEDDKALLYVRITVAGEAVEISLKESIIHKLWDNKAECVKGRTVEVKKINQYIEEVRSRVKDHYRLLEEKNQLITANAIKASYLGVHEIQQSKLLVDLLDYYLKIYKEKMKWGGFKNCETTVRYVKFFLQQKHGVKKVYLTDITMETATELEYYIKMNPLHNKISCKGNGLAKHLQRFNRILNWSVELGWLKVNPIQKYSCVVKHAKRKKLSLEEVQKIEAHQFINVKLQFASDLFLFCCYTGLAFVDVMALRYQDFEIDTEGTWWCRLYRVKSDELCVIPLLSKAKRILDKYWNAEKAQINAQVFPSITNQQINRHLKVFMEVFGVTTNMSFHLARHTFAKTIALKNGIPLETVQMMLGHSKITTTQIYADVDEEKIKGDLMKAEKLIELKRG